ncbi:MAG: glycosyltransferase [Burkholderiales bacterium]|nr:glycosyltransferase [Burkholderiales bacterium]
MQKILISIIIPAYNHQNFIGAAIESVLLQSHKNFELIIIDDHSPDQTAEVIAQYDDPRIKFSAHTTNMGASNTINEGIQKASGDFITILNSDDIFLPNRLERLLAVAERESAEFITTDVELIDKNGKVIRDKHHWWIEWVDGLRALYSSSGDIVQALLAGNFFISTSNFFIKREVFNRIGFFNNYRYTSDYEFILRYLADSQHRLFYLFDEKLLQYRLHGHNTILETPIAPNLETFQIFSRWFPELLQQSIDKQRCYAMNRQLEKVMNYAIDGALRPKQQEIETLRDSLRKKDNLLNKLNEFNYKKDLQIQQLQASKNLMEQELRHQIERLIQSNSYKLGQLIFRPLGYLKKLFK